MLKYHEFVNEKKNDLKNLAWSQKSYEHALRFRIPVTDKLGKLLNGGSKITSFHMTGIEDILNIRSLINKKNSLSTFTEMRTDYLEEMTGINTEGSVLFQLESNLLIKSDYDIMSRPDEQGRRWIDIGNLRNYKFFDFYWDTFIQEIDKKFSTEWQQDLMYAASNNTDVDKNWIKSNSTTIRDYINFYIKKSEEFVLNRKEEFIKMFVSEKDSAWNEVIVNNINVKDVLLHYRFNDTTFVLNIKRHFGSLEKLKEILESFSTGQIYVTVNSAEAIEFVKKRKQK